MRGRWTFTATISPVSRSLARYTWRKTSRACRASIVSLEAGLDDSRAGELAGGRQRLPSARLSEGGGGDGLCREILEHLLNRAPELLLENLEKVGSRDARARTGPHQQQWSE